MITTNGHTLSTLIRTGCIATLLLAALAAAPRAAADDINLPDIGSPADAVLSKSDEARVGRAIMAQIRMSGQVIEDPLVTEYINDIGHRIAAHTNEGEHDFTFFMVDDSRINAFAIPGGYIGVHTGLLDATRNEDELAGVLAHEIAHVTQRHIARALHSNQRQSILTTALMLGAIIAGAAAGDSDVAQAGLAVAQGTAVQQRINFTRANEYEADRIGITALADAGFDPYGMATFFEVMGRLQPSDPSMRAPEFLRTHPVTNTRISEARARAATYPRVRSDDSTMYGIARARTKVAGFDTANQAVAYFEKRDHALQNNMERYGRAIAYQRAGRDVEALQVFEDLIAADQKVIAYHIGLGESQLAMEMYEDGFKTFDRAVRLFPRNVPLVIHYGEWLIRVDRAEDAHAMLLDLLNNVPPTPEQVRLIARAASAAGEDAEAYYYMSEYMLMNGDLVGGVNFLREALALPELQEIQRIRFEARIDFIREFMTEEQLRKSQRSRPASASARNSG